MQLYRGQQGTNTLLLPYTVTIRLKDFEMSAITVVDLRSLTESKILSKIKNHFLKPATFYYPIVLQLKANCCSTPVVGRANGWKQNLT